MSALTYFTCAADYAAALADGIDGDVDPDITPVTATVMFTPLIESGGVFKAVTYTPRPTGFVPVKVPAKIGTDGRLAARVGQADVRLVAETSVLGLASGSHLYYKVEFSDEKVAGVRTSIGDFTFQAPTSDTTVNLISVTPAAGSQAVGITKVGPDAVRLNGSGQVVFSFNGVDLPDPLTLAFTAVDGGSL